MQAHSNVGARPGALALAARGPPLRLRRPSTAVRASREGDQDGAGGNSPGGGTGGSGSSAVAKSNGGVWQSLKVRQQPAWEASRKL